MAEERCPNHNRCFHRAKLHVTAYGECADCGRKLAPVRRLHRYTGTITSANTRYNGAPIT